MLTHAPFVRASRAAGASPTTMTPTTFRNYLRAAEDNAFFHRDDNVGSRSSSDSFAAKFDRALLPGSSRHLLPEREEAGEEDDEKARAINAILRQDY